MKIEPTVHCLITSGKVKWRDDAGRFHVFRAGQTVLLPARIYEQQKRNLRMILENAPKPGSRLILDRPIPVADTQLKREVAVTRAAKTKKKTKTDNDKARPE